MTTLLAPSTLVGRSNAASDKRANSRCRRRARRNVETRPPTGAEDSADCARDSVRIEGQPATQPLIEAAGKRTSALDAEPRQCERRPGARVFVGSGAVKDDLPVAWDLFEARRE